MLLLCFRGSGPTIYLSSLTEDTEARDWLRAKAYDDERLRKQGALIRENGTYAHNPRTQGRWQALKWRRLAPPCIQAYWDEQRPMILRQAVKRALETQEQERVVAARRREQAAAVERYREVGAEYARLQLDLPAYYESCQLNEELQDTTQRPHVPQVAADPLDDYLIMPNDFTGELHTQGYCVMSGSPLCTLSALEPELYKSNSFNDPDRRW